MNRSTWIALVGFLVLLAAVLVLKGWPRGEEEHVFSIAGWEKPKAPEPTAAEANGADAGETPGETPDDTPAETPEEPFAPVDRIELTRGAETIVIEQSGDDKKDWRITAPIEARADWFKIRPILDLFKETLTSSHAKAVKQEDLRVFQLDPHHAITLRLSQGGRPFAELVIGGTEKAERRSSDRFAPADCDTWVFRTGDRNRAYRMPGVDLRTVVDHGLSDLRSKEVFSLDKDAVNRVVIENPDDSLYPRIVIVRETGAEPAEGAAAPAAAGTWRFETPKGFRPGGIDGYLGAVLRLRASEYLPADHAEGTRALAENVARITLESGGNAIVLHVSAAGDQNGFVRVEGRDEIIQVPKYTVTSLRKKLTDLRDKKVFPFGEDAITRLHIVNEHGALDLRLVDGVWTAAAPEGLEVARKHMDRLTRDVANLTVAEFVGNVPPAESGLATPTRRLTVEAAGGVHTLLLGAEVDNKVYGTIEGSGEIFRMSAYNAKKLDKTPDDLRDKKIFPVERDDIVRLELVFPDAEGPVVLVRGEGDEWAMEAPQALADLQVPTMRTMVSTLAALEARSFTPDKRAADVGLEGAVFHLVLHAADGARHTLWISEQKDGGEVYARTDVPRWAGQVFKINDYQARNLQKQVADLTP